MERKLALYIYLSKEYVWLETENSSSDLSFQHLEIKLFPLTSCFRFMTFFFIIISGRNDYEMLLSLDENNHRHAGASTNRINSLPQSTVQVGGGSTSSFQLSFPLIKTLSRPPDLLVYLLLLTICFPSSSDRQHGRSLCNLSRYTDHWRCHSTSTLLAQIS